MGRRFRSGGELPEPKLTRTACRGRLEVFGQPFKGKPQVHPAAAMTGASLAVVRPCRERPARLNQAQHGWHQEITERWCRRLLKGPGGWANALTAWLDGWTAHALGDDGFRCGF